MSILIDEQTRVIVQGFTGDKASFHAREMIAYGTNVVGGVTPGKGGTRHLERPVFDTVKEAASVVGAEASIVFVPPAFAADFDWSPCTKEIAQWCKDVKGDEAIYQCLLRHDADLSKTCDNNGHSKYEELTGKTKR